MNISKALNQFGLENKENDVYLACLELGQAGVYEIAIKANIKRTTTYDVLSNLNKKGLIGQTVKGKKKLFYAEEPEVLNRLLEDKQRKLSEIMPILKSLQNTSGTKPRIRYYEGINGLIEVYNNTLKFDSEILAFGSDIAFNKLGSFPTEYIKNRIKKNIHIRAIAPNSKKIQKYKNIDKKQLREIRTVPSDKFPFTIEMNIYGNRIGFMSFKEEMGIIIESNEISNNMRSLFELAWLGAKKINDSK